MSPTTFCAQYYNICGSHSYSSEEQGKKGPLERVGYTLGAAKRAKIRSRGFNLHVSVSVGPRRLPELFVRHITVSLARKDTVARSRSY